MPRKRTREDFIMRARAIHGGTYDYSKVIYKGAHEKVCIICPKHGDFWQDPTNHISRKSICPKCARENAANSIRSSTESFVSNARIIHGNQYDYSQVDYKHNEKKVCIICPEHGVFMQTPHNHLTGHGCPKCAKLYSYTTEEFISASKAIFGNKFDYSKTEYKSTHTKVCLTCPEHGDFWVTPNNHLSKGSGCPRCSGNYDLTFEEFVDIANKRFNNKYDYSRSKWNGYKVKIEIICPEHGSFFQSPSNHLNSLGCPKCSGHYMDKDLFIQKANTVHNSKYDYSKVDYKANRYKVCIICPEHGEFWQKPNAHLMGHGCPKCANQYMDTQFFIEKASTIHDNKYDYSLVEYTSGLEKVKIICPIHGVFEQVAAYHLAGNGCPACSESHMERDVRRLLKLHNIFFEPQKTFDWLIFDSKMSLDFFIPEYGVAIECQGGQHFKSVDMYGGDKMLSIVQARDAKKKSLCAEHGIAVVYYSDIGIQFPYPVVEDLGKLIDVIRARGDVDSSLWQDPELPFKY